VASGQSSFVIERSDTQFLIQSPVYPRCTESRVADQHEMAEDWRKNQRIPLSKLQKNFNDVTLTKIRTTAITMTC